MSSVLGLAPRASCQDGDKPDRYLTLVTKVSFSDDDRRIAGRYLREHVGEFRRARPQLVKAVRGYGKWNQECAALASTVPRELEERLSELPEGFILRIFDRSLILICTKSNEVVDIVDPAE